MMVSKSAMAVIKTAVVSYNTGRGDAHFEVFCYGYIWTRCAGIVGYQIVAVVKITEMVLGMLLISRLQRL